MAFEFNGAVSYKSHNVILQNAFYVAGIAFSIVLRRTKVVTEKNVVI